MGEEANVVGEDKIFQGGGVGGGWGDKDDRDVAAAAAAAGNGDRGDDDGDNDDDFFFYFLSFVQLTFIIPFLGNKFGLLFLGKTSIRKSSVTHLIRCM